MTQQLAAVNFGDARGLGFGCASLMRLASRRDRQELLFTAWDGGIRHFDVARMYGLGQAEGELGRFLKGRRDSVTVATKFGIEPKAAVGAVARFQGPLRASLERFPAARRAVRSRAESFHAPRHYDATLAQRSLDRSLLELGLEYVDVLFVHDPRPCDEVHADGLRAFFADQKARGTIRAWGVSQDAFPEFAVLETIGDDGLLQIRHDILSEPLPAPAAITFGGPWRIWSHLCCASEATRDGRTVDTPAWR